MSRYEIRLSGSGGQGMITAGIILANAAAVFAGKNAVQSQSYGPEARGGASKAEVIISDGEINFPKVTSPDLLAALTQEAYDKYSADLKIGGIAVTDSAFVRKCREKDFKNYSLPITETVMNELGKQLGANIATVAAVNEIGRFVSTEDLLESVMSMIPKGTEDFNRRAFHIGIRLAGKAMEATGV